MTNISSNATLFFKFFIPVFWLVFGTAFLIGLLLGDAEYVGEVPMFGARVINLVILLLGLLFFYLYVFPLKRVEAGPEFFIVTNYFKNYRYSYDSIEHIEERDWFFFKTFTIVLKERGSFGKKIHFVGSGKRFGKFRAAHPELMARVFKGV